MITRLVLVSLLLGSILSTPTMAARGELELRVTDAESGETIAVQLQLFNQRQRAVKLPGLIRDGDWLVFDGETVLKLPPGRYTFRMRRGLEYRERTGHFVLKSADADNHHVDLPRFVNMAKEGWWSGDLQIRPTSLSHLATRVLASDLHLVPVTCVDQQHSLSLSPNVADRLRRDVGNRRIVQLSGAADRRLGSFALLFAPEQLPAVPAVHQTLPTPWDIARSLHAASSGTHAPHVHLAHASCWDLPTWIAFDEVDSIGLLHDGLRAGSSVAAPEDRPRDVVLYPDPEGVARWSQQIYFRLLETGVRIPPGAGSGADDSGNPLGYSRVYVYCGDKFSASAWWDGLRAGRVVVTNGPLLRPRVSGQLPGHVFRARKGETLPLEVELQLSTQDKIRYLEIIKNGRPVQQVRLEDWAAQKGRLPPVEFKRSGWLVVRAVAEHPSSYRAAVSGPFYVEFDDQPRISRQAAQFFLDWVYQRARSLKLPDSTQQHAVLVQQRDARDYWQGRVDDANAD